MASADLADASVEVHAFNWHIGLICCAVAAVGFGSNYLPVKRIDCGDGFFFAFCMSLGIGFVGFVVNFSDLTTGEYFKGPEFHPLAMLGGACWMLGNLLTPTVIRLIGLGVGLSVWSLSNMFMGWATGFFGLFGIWREPIQSPGKNFAGLGLAAVSLVLLTWAIEDATPETIQEAPSPREKQAAPRGHDASSGELDVEDPELGSEGLPSGPLSLKVRHSAGGGAAVISTVAREEGAAAHGQEEFGTELPIEDPRLGPLRSTPGQPFSEIEHSTDTLNSHHVFEAVHDALAGPEAIDPGLLASSASIDTTSSTSSATIGDDMSVSRKEGKTDMADMAEGLQSRARLASLSTRCSQVVGILLALVAGMLLGSTFDPSTVLLQMAIAGDVRYSEHTFDYIYCSYAGIVLTGVASFAAYLCVMRKVAFVKREIILPGIASGLLCGIAQTARFKAYQELSIVVAFPIITALPGMVAMMWSVLLFGELKSTRSRICAGLAMALRVPSVVLIAMSDVAR